MLLLSAFLLFDSDFSSPVAENRTIFAVLSAMLVTILQACPTSTTFTDIQATAVSRATRTEHTASYIAGWDCRSGGA